MLFRGFDGGVSWALFLVVIAGALVAAVTFTARCRWRAAWAWKRHVSDFLEPLHDSPRYETLARPISPTGFLPSALCLSSLTLATWSCAISRGARARKLDGQKCRAFGDYY